MACHRQTEASSVSSSVPQASTDVARKPRNPKSYPHPRLQDFPRWKKTLQNTENEERPGGRNWGVGISFWASGSPGRSPARTAPRRRRAPGGRRLHARNRHLRDHRGFLLELSYGFSAALSNICSCLWFLACNILPRAPAPATPRWGSTAPRRWRCQWPRLGCGQMGSALMGPPQK